MQKITGENLCWASQRSKDSPLNICQPSSTWVPFSNGESIKASKRQEWAPLSDSKLCSRYGGSNSDCSFGHQAIRIRALDKREYLMILFLISHLIVTHHLNCLDEPVQMRSHNICFEAE